MSSLPSHESSDHLSEETILLLTTGELDAKTQDEANQHLETCAHCRQKLENASSFRVLLQDALQWRDEVMFARRLNRAAPFRSTRWIAAGVTVTFLLWTLFPRKIEAKEVLDRAVTAEIHRSSTPRLVRVRAGQTSCTLGLVPTVTISTYCGALASTFRSIPWDWQHPLSARTFYSWHSSLSQKTDSVLQTQGKFVVTTTSDKNPIRVAELTLASSDYRVTNTILRVFNGPPIEISEEAPSNSSQEIANLPNAPHLVENVPSDQDNHRLTSEAVDMVEAETWTTLDRLNFLNGWKATVRRSGQHIDVITGSIDAEERKDLLKALSSAHSTGLLRIYPSSQAAKFTPERESFQPIPPLGQHWLHEILPPGTDKTILTNQLLNASQRILGLASIREQLLSRSRALQDCPCNARVQTLVKKQNQELRDATGQLMTLLDPLFTRTSSIPPLLSSMAAHHLDTALIHVFASGPAEPSTLDDQIVQIEKTLPVRAQKF